LKRLKTLIELIVYPLIIGLIIGAVYFMEKYRYDDCRKVGHTFWYCLMDINK
jgi:ABC-type transport system involved in cytochrome c biogenesis permease component